MLTAARNFLESLTSDQQRRVLFPLGDPERFNWNYMPGPRRGVPLREMTEAQRQSTLALLKSALSRQGYEKATGIMALELILGELEGRGARGEGHYYRIHGPTVLIEYDNTQNNANHIHTVMRDIENDFGLDLLRRHYAECSH
jgi:hypothetical protein